MSGTVLKLTAFTYNIYLWVWMSFPSIYPSPSLFNALSIRSVTPHRSSISSTLPEIQSYFPLSSCERGQLHWYYPRGGLRTTFTHQSTDADFTLCLVYTQQSYITSIYNETQGTAGSSIPSPAPGLSAGKIIECHSTTGLIFVTGAYPRFAEGRSQDVITLDPWRGFPHWGRFGGMLPGKTL